MQQRLPSLLDPPIAFAHRGARAHAPDNTIESFELALRLGATGLESDVWLTSDGVPVLDHDGIVKQGLRRRPIADLADHDFRRTSRPSPRCSTRAAPAIALSLDLKDTRSGAAVIDTVRDHDPDMLERLWLCDTDVDRAGRAPSVERRRPSDAVDPTRSHQGGPGAPCRPSRPGRDRRRSTCNRRDWNGGLVVLFHRFGRYAFGWDVQFEHELRDGLRMGLDGVYSDHVDVMMDAMRAEIGSI